MLPQLLAAAVVGALSPAAALAAIMLLGSGRPVANTLACLAGWVVGLMLLGVALRSLIGARHPVVRLVDEGRGAPVEMPGWMRRIEHLHPAGAFLFGMVLIAVSPADVAAYFGAVQALLGSDAADGTRLVLLLLLIAGISSCIVLPLLVYLALPRRADDVLAAGRVWIVAHQRVVNGGAAGVFGLLLIGNAIASVPG